MTWFQRIFLLLFLTFLSILSVTGTIALRNILHLALLGMLLIYVLKEFSREPNRIKEFLKCIPVNLVFWFAYILVFPLFAPDGHGALENMLGKGMWGESLLTWILAGGAVLILGESQLGLWRLALVSATPTFIHLFLLILAWAGMLQPSFYEDPSLGQVAKSFVNVIQGTTLTHDAFEKFPFGFRGIEPMHGNLGYPASQAICLALAVAFAAWRNADYSSLLKAVALISACILSVVIAQSRAAAYFGIVLILLGLIAYWISHSNNSNNGEFKKHSKAFVWRIGGGICLAVIFSFGLFYKVASENILWYSMWDKLSLGFELKAPQKLLCDGFSTQVDSFVRGKYPESSEEYIATLVEGLNGDGARVLMARAGIDLVRQYPWGLNGGRDAYQLRMKEVCGHTPELNYSHAHNAWINIILAIGCIGGVLYASLLFAFAVRAWRTLKVEKYWPHGIALFLLAVFWFLRGFVDAVFQEHYLQMQASMLIIVFLSSQYHFTNQDLKSGLTRMSS
jgi:hypothetical protein